MTFLDRIKETSTSTGTGTFTLGGAVLGYKVFTNGTYKYCIVNETESEWEVGEGTVASGVLTRTTIEASSNGGAAVSFSAGTKYVFNTVSAAYVNSLVPYTGATASVNLGAYGLTSDYLQLSTTPTATGAVGRMLWNDQIGSTETTLKGGSVVLKNGVDLVARVVNKVTPAATLTKATYKAVRVSGAQGQRLAIAYAQANNDNNSADTIGLVCETIAANQEGFIITVGQLTGINTTGSLQGETWADGDVLYLSPTTAGNLTNIKPTGATGHIVVIGYVEYAHANNGSIYVKIMNGWELDELHNVYINAVANNQVLVYESATDLWKNKSIATILGYTAADDSLIVHLAGAENITGVKTFQNALKTTTGNNLLNTGGGNTVIGYTADPATSTLYKLDVNGKTKTATLLVNDGSTYSIEYNASTTNGKLLSKGSYPSFTLQTAAGQNRVNIENGGPNAIIQMWYGTTSSIYLDTNADGYYALGFAYGKTSAPVASAILELSATNRGFLLPRMTTAQKTAITTPATSLLVYDTDLSAFQYYSGSAWTSLGGGGGISGSGTAGQVTYWSGTSAVTGSSNFTWDGTNILLGNDKGIVLSVAGTNRATKIYPTNSADNFSAIGFYPSSGTNVGQSFQVIPKGTGYSATIKSQFSIFNTDFVADATNYEVMVVRAAATAFTIASGKGGSGTVRPILLSAGFTDGSTNANQLWLYTSGNVGINSSADGGQRLQVIGSMRVGTTAASAMYWDDTNSRLIIGNTSGTARLDIGASTTSAASLRIRSGTAPTTPNEGDIWQDGTNIKIYIGGSTKTFTII